MVKTPRLTLRFTRLRLRNWRNFDQVDVQLGERAFFVGANASGKSNLLDVIRFLSELARPGTGGLQGAIAERGEFSSLRNLNARNPSAIVIDVDIGTTEVPRRWNYYLRINTLGIEKIATVLEERVVENDAIVIERKRSSADEAFLFTQSYLEQAQISAKFRDLTEFLGSCRYLHVVPQIVRERERGRSKGEDPYGGDLLRRMKDVPEKTRGPRLKRISNGLRIAVPQFQELELLDDKEGVPHLYASYGHWRPKVSKQPERLFSDGTLRLIGLLWSISERGGPLLLEEPELSLNDAVVSQLPQMFLTMQAMSHRQVLATTHSSALLDDEGIGLGEVHVIIANSKGSTVETALSNARVVAQVDGGMTVGQAILPLLRPPGVEGLGKAALIG